MADTDDPFALSLTSPLADAPDVRPKVTNDRYQERMDALYDKQDKLIGRAEEAMGREEQIQAEKSRALAPVRQRMMDLATQPLPERPQLQKPPEAPKRNRAEDQETWLFASALLGSLAGAFTRRHQTNALAAFTGAMEGYNEGSRQKFDENMKVWEAENKRTLEANQQAMDHYRGILEDRKLSMDQMAVALQVAAAHYEDDAMATAAKSKNSLVIAQLYDKQAEALGRMRTSSENMSFKYAQLQQKERIELAKQQMRALGVNDPARMSATIDEIGNYRAQPITGRAGTAIMELVYQKYPDYDQKKWFDEKLRAQIPARVEGAKETTEARIGAARETQLDLILRSAKPALQGAAEAAAKVPQTTFVPLNKLWNMANEMIGDPAIVEFKMANMTLVEAWARAMNPTGQLTVYNTQRASEILGTAQSPEAYYAQLQYLNKLLDRELQIVKDRQEGKPPPKFEIGPPPHSTTIPQVGDVAGQRAGEAGERALGSNPPSASWEEWSQSEGWLPKGWRVFRDLYQSRYPNVATHPERLTPPAEGWKVEQVQ